MPRLKALSERNKTIYDSYRKIYDEQFLRHRKILEILSGQFYLSEDTIQKIVLQESNKRKNNVGQS